MLAKPESGTPDCNKLTIKEKDDMKDVPLLMVQLSYPSWYTEEHIYGHSHDNQTTKIF